MPHGGMPTLVPKGHRGPPWRPIAFPCLIPPTAPDPPRLQGSPRLGPCPHLTRRHRRTGVQIGRPCAGAAAPRARHVAIAAAADRARADQRRVPSTLHLPAYRGGEGSDTPIRAGPRGRLHLPGPGGRPLAGRHRVGARHLRRLRGHRDLPARRGLTRSSVRRAWQRGQDPAARPGSDVAVRGGCASEIACKPSSVPSSLTATVIHLGPRSPMASSGRPESGATHPCPGTEVSERALLFGLAPGRACPFHPPSRPRGR
jgi:hypothetical protein